jgi:serpin B
MPTPPVDPCNPQIPYATTIPVIGMGVIDPGTSGQTPPPPPPPTFRMIVEGDNTFATDLYSVLAAKDKGNVLFSPAGVEAELGAAYAGSAGETAGQMAQVLRFSLAPDKYPAAFADLLAKLNGPAGKPVAQRNYQLVLASSLWRQKGQVFQEEFIRLLLSSFAAPLNTVDFTQVEQARKAINDWAAHQTQDRIKVLLPQGGLSAQAHLVLTSAVCLRSGWQERFRKDETQDGPFKVSADKSVDVMMMHLRKRFDYVGTDTLQMLELPYAGGELSMLVFLPAKADGLAEMEQGLSAASIDKWIKDKHGATVDITLPRFALSGEHLLARTLKDMGLADPFDPDRASFPPMSVGGKLWASQVVHKALLAADEDGTDAAPVAPAEAVGLAEVVRLDNPKVFKADHPFVIVVRHNATGHILFMGRVANPKGEAQ